MKRQIVVAAMTAVFAQHAAAASQFRPRVDIAGVGVGSPVSEFVALLPEGNRPVVSPTGPFDIEVPIRLFALDGHMAVKGRSGRIDRVSIDLKGEPERVAAAVVTLDEQLSVFSKEAPDWWRSWYAADGACVAQLHVYEDALILILDDFRD
jgi:hypothetical protein